MIAYVRRIAQELAQKINESVLPGGIDFLSVNVSSWFTVLAEELDRLDPRDFLPAAQFDFVDARRRVRAWRRVEQNSWVALFSGIHLGGSLLNVIPQIASETEAPTDVRQQIVDGQLDEDGGDLNRSFAAKGLVTYALTLCRTVANLLDQYGGEDSRSIIRSFTFVQDAGLRRIVERDCRELTLCLFPGGAWKSTVIMAGSILEAVLYDLLTRDAARIAAAMNATNAPQRNGSPRNITSDSWGDKWNLEDYIEVAAELNLLPAARAKAIDQVLRDYRNFVHPRKELRSGHECTEAEAMQSLGTLNAVCDHFAQSGAP